MPQDHPDGTVPMQLTGTDKKVPTDWQDQYVGVYLQPGWAALKGTDKNIRGLFNNQGWQGQLQVSYTVPAGKTFYITLVAGGAVANASGDASKIQNIRLGLWNDTTSTWIAETAGQGGIVLPMGKPVSVDSGEKIQLFVDNYAAHNSNLYGTIMGHEI